MLNLDQQYLSALRTILNYGYADEATCNFLGLQHFVISNVTKAFPILSVINTDFDKAQSVSKLAWDHNDWRETVALGQTAILANTSNLFLTPHPAFKFHLYKASYGYCLDFYCSRDEVDFLTDLPLDLAVVSLLHAQLALALSTQACPVRPIKFIYGAIRAHFCERNHMYARKLVRNNTNYYLSTSPILDSNQNLINYRLD